MTIKGKTCKVKTKRVDCVLASQQLYNHSIVSMSTTWTAWNVVKRTIFFVLTKPFLLAKHLWFLIIFVAVSLQTTEFQTVMTKQKQRLLIFQVIFIFLIPRDEVPFNFTGTTEDYVILNEALCKQFVPSSTELKTDCIGEKGWKEEKIPRNSLTQEQANEKAVPLKENTQINSYLIELVLSLCVQTRTRGNKVCELPLHHSLPCIQIVKSVFQSSEWKHVHF